MDQTIKKLVFRYLDNTYKLEERSLQNFQVYCKPKGGDVSIATMYDDVKEIFNLHPYNCGAYFNAWIDHAALKLNNELVDELYDWYSEVRTTPMPNTKAIQLRALAVNNNKGNLYGAIHEGLNRMDY